MVEVGERAAEPGQVGGDHLLGHVPQPGVDQEQALVPEQEVLADVALAEVALDAVDARRPPPCGRIVCRRRAAWDDPRMAVDSQPARGARRSPLSELLIVDADVHVHESPGELAPYCDPPWDVALRNVADVPERYLDIPGFSPGGDGTLTARFPTLARGDAHGAHARADGRRARGDRHRPRRAVPRPPAQARPCCPRPTTRRRWPAPTTPGSSTAGPRATARCSARSRPARRTRRTPRARSSATPTTRRSSPSTCPAPASTRCGATAATTRSSTRRRTPACRCCCTR